jgi:hypothetical protein
VLSAVYRREVMDTSVERISPAEAREHLLSGALLVCAYNSEDKFRQNSLEGAISLATFRAREGSIPHDREVIFYCA